MVQRLKMLIYSLKYRHLVPLSSTSKKKKKILESLVKTSDCNISQKKQTNKKGTSKLESATNSHCDCEHIFSP